MLTFVYGLTDCNEKYTLWSYLEHIGNCFSVPWLLMDDFDSLLSQADKIGGRPVASASSGDFFNFMLNIGLMDIGYAGNPFTWNNEI